MTRIDQNVVYVPQKYIGKQIAIAEVGTSYNKGSWVGKVVKCPEGGGLANHKNRAKLGKNYEIFEWNTKEFIGAAKCQYISASSIYSENNTDESREIFVLFPKDEFLLWSFIALPFRLAYDLIRAVFVLGLSAIIWAFKVVLSLLIIALSIAILPLKILGFIITLGQWNTFEKRVINWLGDLWE